MTTTETIRTLVEGHWIKDNGIYKCTACNSLCTVAGWADCIPEKQMYKVFRFCPYCGAKMDEMKVNNSKGIDLWMTKEDFNSLYEDDVEDGV